MTYAIKGILAAALLALPLTAVLAETPVQDQQRDQDKINAGETVTLEQRKQELERSREAYKKTVREHGKNSAQAKEARKVMEECRERYRVMQREQIHDPQRMRDQQHRMDGTGPGTGKGR